MRLQIGKKVINYPLEDILLRLREDSGYRYIKDIKKQRNDILITCPFHKNGTESNPSCSVHSVDTDDEMFGTYHCWSCGESGSLIKLVNHCLKTFDGDKWLTDNFSTMFINEVDIPGPIEFNSETVSIDDSILDNLDYNNEDALEYLLGKRRLSYPVLSKFRVGYDKDKNSVSFPIWDEHGKLVGISYRNISSKIFNLPSFANKPIYLLNEAKYFNSVYVVESQINALTLWGWGYPAIALLGTGSSYQYDILNKCGIFHYILCFDGDNAGKKGEERFIKNVVNSVMISRKIIPNGKDVNDLDRVEFDSIPLLSAV